MRNHFLLFKLFFMFCKHLGYSRRIRAKLSKMRTKQNKNRTEQKSEHNCKL